MHERDIDQESLDELGEPMVLQPDGWAGASDKEEYFPRKDDNLLGNKMTPHCFTYRPLWSFDKARDLNDPPSLTHLYSVLWSFANLDFIAWPSIDEIVERSGMSKEDVNIGIGELVNHSLVHIHTGLLEECRRVYDFGDRDVDSVRAHLVDVPKKIRPSLKRTSRS